MVSSKKKVLSAFLSLAMIGSMVAAVPLTANADDTTATAPVVTYSVHQQTYGWESTVTGPATAGVTGQSKRLEALKINAPSGATISYSVHQQTYGWEAAVTNGATAGVTGKSKRLEAVKISLTDLPGYTIEYRVHQQTYGWESWVKNGEVAGVTGQSKRLEAIQIKLVPTVATVSAVNGTIGVGGSTIFAFKDADGNAYTPKTVTYSLEDSSFGSIDSTGKFTASKAGAAVVDVVADGVSLSTTVNVYGQVSAVKLTPASTSIVADGSATDVITINAVDANGNVVSNYNGTVNVALSTGIGTLSATNNISITNGTGTVTYTAPASVPGTAPVILTSGLLAATGSSQSASISYGTLTLTYTSSAAASISLSPASAVVSSNGNTLNNITYKVLNSAGTSIANQTEYVTFTITGPGSFSQGGTPVTTLSEYLTSATNGLTIPVYAIQGVNGTVTVSAAVSGLSTATASFTTAQTTAPSSFKVTSATSTLSASFTAVGSVSLPAGTTFTTYTVQLLDKNGIAVAPSVADALTISDNTSTTGGALGYYLPDANGQPSAGAGTIASLSAALPTTTGSFSFIVLNTTTASTNPTITVKDALLASTQTVAYSFVTSTASEVGFIGLNSATAADTSVKAGQTITYQVQLEDASGNALSAANQVVKFYFDATNTPAATIGSISSWVSANPYTTLTDSTGKASVTVVFPSGATGSVTLTAAYGSSTAANDIAVQALSSYATSLGLSTTAPATSQASGTANIFGATTTISALNGVGTQANATDVLQVASSNYSVLSVNGGTSAVTVTSGGNFPVIAALATGSATITVTDLTNPTVPALSYTFTVTAGSAAAVKALNPDGTTDTAYTFPTAGVSSPFTLEIVDGGGNVVGATYPTTLTSAQVLTALGLSASAGYGVRLTATGSDVTSVSFAQGQSTQIVYVDNVAASAATTAQTAVSLSTETPVASAAVTGSTVTLTFNNPIYGSAAVGDFDVEVASASDVVTAYTLVNATTVTLTLTTAPTHGQVVTIAYSGTSLTTGYGAAATFTTTPVTNNN